MATGKRYYWMKLKESFMTSDTIDYFMSQPDGANYVVLYQMLCLKTINTDGRLSRQIGEIIIPFDAEKIQRDCKWFSIDTIRVALNLYRQVGLVYEDVDGTLVLTDHDDLVGSETDWASQKRNQQKQIQNGQSRNSSALCSGDSAETGVEIFHTDIRDKRLDIREREQSSDLDIRDLTDSCESVCRTKDVRRIVESWNALGLGQIVRLSPESKRGGNLRARVNEYGAQKVLDAIEAIRDSDFLRGQNKDGWIITFDWFVKPTNFVKVLERNYDRRAPQANRQSQSSMDDLRELHDLFGKEDVDE